MTALGGPPLADSVATGPRDGPRICPQAMRGAYRGGAADPREGTPCAPPLWVPAARAGKVGYTVGWIKFVSTEGLAMPMGRRNHIAETILAGAAALALVVGFTGLRAVRADTTGGTANANNGGGGQTAPVDNANANTNATQTGGGSDNGTGTSPTLSPPGGQDTGATNGATTGSGGTGGAGGASSNAGNSTGFLGVIHGRNIYVRSGPNTTYYELGHLNNGDTVKVVARKNGWDMIDAPTGTVCYVAKQFIAVGGDTTRGKVTADDVNVRAASALHPQSDYAVVNLLHKGARVHILGSTSKYYKISAPRHTHVYVSGKFVRAAGADASYSRPALSVNGAAGSGNGQTGFVVPLASGNAGTQPSDNTNGGTNSSGGSGGSGVGVPSLNPPPGGSTSSTQPGGAPGTAKVRGGATLISVPNATTRPRGSDPYARFSRLNRALQVQLRKPLLKRKLRGLLRRYQRLMKTPKLPGSVRRGSVVRLNIIRHEISIQNLDSGSLSMHALNQRLRPYQQRWQKAKNAMSHVRRRAPYLAKGVLRTSSALRSLYVLVDPATGRVTAYISPDSRINITRLLGQYIGVKGQVVGSAGTLVKKIKVISATMLPKPRIQGDTRHRHRR